MTKQDTASSALRLNAGQSVRAEDLKNYLDFFVEPINTDVLTGNANQLVYGRRGSGKTLMLSTLNERLRRSFPEERVYSFYFDATKFRSSLEYGGIVPSVRDKTHAYFHAFIEQLCNNILYLADQVLRKPTWLAQLTLAGEAQAHRRDDLVTAVLELLEAASYGAESPDPSTIVKSHEQSSSQGRSRNKNASISLSTDPTLSALSPLQAGAALGGASSFESQLINRVTRNPKRKFSPARVRELLVRIVELLDLDYIVIFIDEWMTLAECQVDFAERLRQCLFGEDRIGVKIAADQYQGHFNNSGQGHSFRGLEIGGDIFLGVDLDRPFREPNRSQPLFAEALYRRLLHFEPGLADYFGQAPLQNPKFFLDTVFASDQAFAELCLGAQGLCRDFHLIFQDCSKEINWNLSDRRIDFECVRRAIIERTDQTYDRAIRSVDSNALLFRVIAPHVQKTRSRFFITESRPGPLTHIVKDLLTKRIIHPVPGSNLHPSVRGEFDCFEIDYGIYIELMRAVEFQTGEKIDDTYNAAAAATITSVNKAHFRLDLSPLAAVANADHQLMLCVHCGMQFDVTEKAYVVAKVCPRCFEDPSERSATDG